MSGTTGDQGKGFFHRATGVPFWEAASGNWTGYLQKKENLTKQLKIAQTEQVEQLKIQSDIDSQLSENYQRVIDLSSQGNETQRKIASRLEVEKRMQARMDNYLYRNPRNTVDSIVSYIPYIGPFYKWGLVAKDGYNEYQDRQILTQMQPKEDYEKQILSIRTDLQSTGTDINKLLEKQIANNNVLKNLTEIQTNTQTELNKM